MNCGTEYYSLWSGSGEQFSIRVTYVKIGNSRIMQINLLLLHSPPSYTLYVVGFPAVHLRRNFFRSTQSDKKIRWEKLGKTI